MLEDIYVERTSKTPEIHFQYEIGELYISGVSIPENTVDFYHNIMQF
mgnify:CR=1 FL=1